MVRIGQRRSPMVRVTEAEARKRFGELIRDVTEGGETVLIEEDGGSQAVVISLQEYTRLRTTEETRGKDWRSRVERLRERVSQELGEDKLTPAEEVIQRMREERDEQILGSLR
jgi:prevent-host-death family protein